ncbi:MAG: family 16 glycoside hydrolase, partial [Alphaproteobacteria bacterium]
RQEHPNRYEQPAPVAIETWHRLRLDIRGSRLQAFVDGESVLTVADLRFPDRTGRIGLWVDDGTTGYFRDLRVTPA